MNTVNRSWQPAETRLLAEYLAMFYADYPCQERVRVGSYRGTLEIPGLTPAEVRLLGVWRRWVDAVVLMPAETILIEAAIRPDPGDVSQLELYMHLWGSTPEFADRATLPTRGELVYAVPDPVIPMLAARRGFTVHLFRPAWVKGYLLTLPPRYRGPSLVPVS